MIKIKRNNSLFALLVLLTITSCEEVIELDLNSASPVVVAEGYMEKDSVCQVRLTYTTDYFHDESPLVIEDATVSIANNFGESEILVYQSDGVYSGDTLRGSVLTDYTATIETGGQLYTGSSSLMPVPEIISITYEEAGFGLTKPGEETPLVLTISLRNDQTLPDNYMLKFKQNGAAAGDSFQLLTDRYTSSAEEVQYNSMMLQFYPGDTVYVEIYAIDEETYRYYSQLNDAIGGGMALSSTPYNPASNLGNNLLGYFMARSRSDSTFILY